VPTATSSYVFSFTATPTTAIYTLSLHDALPISLGDAPLDAFEHRRVLVLHPFVLCGLRAPEQELRIVVHQREHVRKRACTLALRSEEHTSELQSRSDLVCRLLLEKKKKIRHVKD